MRVHVPFGKGNRLIQGIVVDVLEEADTSEELKAIVEILDYTPVSVSYTHLEKDSIDCFH